MPEASFLDTQLPKEIVTKKGRLKRKVRSGILFVVGYILSPLSWWNDALINIPFSYLIANLFSYLWPATFEWAFILCYWATNISGLVLMHIAQHDFLRQKFETQKLWKSIVIALIYTVAIIILMRTKLVIPVLNTIFTR